MARISAQVVAAPLPHQNEEACDLHLQRPVDLPGPWPTEDAHGFNVRTHHYIVELHQQYGDRFLLSKDGSPRVFVRDLPAIRKVLTSADFAKTWASDKVSSDKVDYVGNLIQPLTTGTVFNHLGEDSTEVALEARRKLRPMFIGAKGFANDVRTSIDADLAATKEGPVNALTWCHDLCRKAILVLITGEMAETANAKIMGACNPVLDYFVKRYSMGPGDEYFNPCVSKMDEETMQRLVDACTEVVEEFKDREAAGQFSDTVAHRQCLMSLIGKHNKTNLELSKLIVNIIIAGGEAIASLLAQIMQEVAFNKPIQERILEEARGLSDNNPESEYIESCILEGMRMFAPATYVQRVALRDTELPGGVRIPAGQIIAICATAVHHNPALFENSWTFDPSREGMDLGDINMVNSALMSFSGGQRGCPGRHLALACLNICIPKIVERFEILPAGPSRTEWHPESSNAGVRKWCEWPTNGIPLNLRQRAIR